MHYLDHNIEKDNFMAIKLDMSNAYNRVEWAFTKKVLQRLGFHEKWIKWILKWISIVFYSILINGEAHGSIVPFGGFARETLYHPIFPYYVRRLSHL